MVYVANSKSGGIAAFELNRADGKLSERERHLPDMGVSPLAVGPDRRFLYANIRSKPHGLACFAVDRSTGGLRRLNAVPAPASFTYMSVDAGGRFLLAASYGGDLVWALPLGREGMVHPEPACELRPGRNPHCVVLDPSNRFAYIPLLGSDHVAQYCFNAATGELVPNHPPLVATDYEAGPRHMIFSPDGRFAHLLTELSGDVITYAVNRERGLLTPAHSTPLLPSENALPPSAYMPSANTAIRRKLPPVMWAADIRATPDGRFLYASERTGSTLSCFAVDAASGVLDFRRITETEERPRGTAVDPFGEFFFVAGEKSNRVAAYFLNRETGELSLADAKESGVGPNWVEAVVFH